MGSAVRRGWEELGWLNSAPGDSWMWKAKLSLLPGQENRGTAPSAHSDHHPLSCCCFKHKVCSTCGEGMFYSSEKSHHYLRFAQKFLKCDKCSDLSLCSVHLGECLFDTAILLEVSNYLWALDLFQKAGGKVKKNESFLNYLSIQEERKKKKKERASLSSFWIFRHLMYTWRCHALKQAFNMWLIPVRIIFLPLLSEALSWAEKESDSCVNKIFKIIPKSVCFSSNLHHQLLPAPKCLFSLLQVHKWEDWNQHQLWMGFQYCSGEEVGESSVN